MRKGLAAGAVFATVLLAGCSGGGRSTTPTSDAPSEPAPQTSSSARTAPAKSLEISDKCTVVAEAQWRALGADQAPREGDMNGVPGCSYQAGKAGTEGGWSVLVAADKTQTFKQFVNGYNGVQMTEVAGYPAAQVGTNKTNCIFVVDVSDQGSLSFDTLARTGDPNPCDLSKQFAEAALKNLPNA